jgi:hypothetical protein
MADLFKLKKHQPIILRIWLPVLQIVWRKGLEACVNYTLF